jgi:predicted  nucleic acid-binding Zn-ribbon protein
MIQAILLIALGFLTASLIGVLVAPSLWNRAYRLSRKRLEQTLPISLAEIEAAQDQLKASYAVRMRRLETALASAKQKAAMQLVDNSRLQMQIVALRDQITDLDLRLSERRNAATVLEQTITKRFPELDREITAVKQQLQERSYELQDLTNKLGRRSEELEAADKAAASYQTELSRLREALEKNGGDRTGRRLRRASQWSLEDYRAEYDRLNLDLSKLRQQLAQLQDKDAQQTGVIKGELQRLAELILVSSQPKGEPRPSDRLETAAKRASTEPRRDRPVPWPEGIPSEIQVPGLHKAEAAADGEPALAALDAADEASVTSALNSSSSEASQAGVSLRERDQDTLSAGTAPPGPSRSRLLREAVAEKPARQPSRNGSAAEEGETSSGKSGNASGDLPKQLAQDVQLTAGTSNGSTHAQQGLKERPSLDPTAGDRSAQGRTLLERLKEATEGTAEADK